MSTLWVWNCELDPREFELDRKVLYTSGTEPFFDAVCAHLALPRDSVVRLYQQYDEKDELLNPETEEPEMYEARQKLEVRFVLALGEHHRLGEVRDDRLVTIPTERAIERIDEQNPVPISFAEYRELWTEYYGNLDLTASLAEYREL
jgi:hypothetical protein